MESPMDAYVKAFSVTPRRAPFTFLLGGAPDVD